MGGRSYLRVGFPWKQLLMAAGRYYIGRPHLYAGGTRYPVPLRHIKIGFGELFPVSTKPREFQIVSASLIG
jgi:hypothetical protein